MEQQPNVLNFSLGTSRDASETVDRPAGGMVDLLVNGVLVARGEVVVVDERFGVRISEVVGSVAAETTPK